MTKLKARTAGTTGIVLALSGMGATAKAQPSVGQAGIVVSVAATGDRDLRSPVIDPDVH